MNKTKAIALVAEDSELATIVSGLGVLLKQTCERHEFLKKSFSDMEKKTKKDASELWDKIGAHLVKTGKLEKYDSKETSLAISENYDVIFLRDRTEDSPSKNDFIEMIKGLFDK